VCPVLSGSVQQWRSQGVAIWVGKPVCINNHFWFSNVLTQRLKTIHKIPNNSLGKRVFPLFHYKQSRGGVHLFIYTCGFCYEANLLSGEGHYFTHSPSVNLASYG